MAKIIPYNPKLKQLALKLRKDMTFGEVLLWSELKENKLLGFDFDRQRCIDNYIVDFYCKDLQSTIEVDGMSHNHEEAFAKDNLRQQTLENLGVRFARFTDAGMKDDMVNVVRSIEATTIEIVKADHTIKIHTSFDKSLLE